MKQRKQPVRPDRQDYAAVNRRYGELPATASDEEAARHYRLAQACKPIRLYEQGRLPLDQMRYMDGLRGK
jgi:hypothetical protein